MASLRIAQERTGPRALCGACFAGERTPLLGDFAAAWQGLDGASDVALRLFTHD